MRLIIAGGGTGGHLFPGVAIAEELKARDQAGQILFVGTARGMESHTLPKLGWKVELIDASGIKTKGILGMLRGIVTLPRAYFQARRILKTFAPDAVIGVGGYASFPTVLAARMRKIPTAVLENNSVPGLANKWLGKWTNAVFVAFDQAKGYFKPDRVLVTGSPIRAQLRQRLLEAGPAVRTADGRINIFCFGGSQGAEYVNKMMVGGARYLDADKVRFNIVHQTGKADHDATARAYSDAGIPADVRPFIDNMAYEYDRAHVVVARAGASTISELGAIGRAAILIPYPHAADNHQVINARIVERAGAAIVYEESELKDGFLIATAIRQLVEEPDRLERMQSAMKSLGRPHAATSIVDWLGVPRG